MITFVFILKTRMFQLNAWLSRTDRRTKTGFLQWRPVCYNNLKRARDKATGMKKYDLQDIDKRAEDVLSSTFVYGFFGQELVDITKQMQNLSFGIGKDGGYNKTGVLTW